MIKLNLKNTGSGAWARLTILLLAIINQFLIILGYSPIPFLEADIESLFSLIFLLIAGWTSWWKDNDVTKFAKTRKKIANDEIDKAIKERE